LYESPHNNLAVRHEQGFAVYVLGNDRIEIAVVPELGARIISLKDLRTGASGCGIRPVAGSCFAIKSATIFRPARSSARMNVCLPLRRVCARPPASDHGEVWCVPWQLDADARENGVLKTSVALSRSPFEIERAIELNENEIRLDYVLRNRSKATEQFLWAMHPLLRLREGDQLELPASTRALLNGVSWLDDLTTPIRRRLRQDFRDTSYRRFCGDSQCGDWRPAGVRVVAHREQHAGVWLTRGGWHGHEHFALEPTNSDADTLAGAAARQRCGTVAAADSVSWQVCLRVGS